MLSRNKVAFNKIDKKDYYIYIDKNNNRGIFNPYYKGAYNSFFYDFKIDKRRIFHKNAKSYSIFDISLDGKRIITLSNDTNELANNVLKILEIGTNKILLELNYMYVYEAYFTGNPRYILCRGKEFNITSTFVYDIINKKTVYLLKENIFINSGGFDEQRNFFIYPSIYEGNILYQLNFSTFSDVRYFIDYPNIKISKVYLIEDRDLALIEGNKTIYLYGNKRIAWKIDFSSLFTAEYNGGIFYLNRKIYLDSPAFISESDNSNIVSNMVLFRIDQDSGAVEYIILPKDEKIQKILPYVRQ